MPWWSFVVVVVFFSFLFVFPLNLPVSIPQIFCVSAYIYFITCDLQKKQAVFGFDFNVQVEKLKASVNKHFSLVSLSSVLRIGSDQETGKGCPVSSPDRLGDAFLCSPPQPHVLAGVHVHNQSLAHVIPGRSVPVRNAENIMEGKQLFFSMGHCLYVGVLSPVDR